MDWSNERWVKLYTRDTGDLLAVGWEGRALFYELLRKADRAGVVDETDPAILAALSRMPFEVVERVLPKLVARGCIEITDGAIVLPNYLEAQEAPRSDAARQRESRARRRDRARLGKLQADSRQLQKVSRTITQPVATVTQPVATVTQQDFLAHPVTTRQDKTRRDKNNTLSQLPGGSPTAAEAGKARSQKPKQQPSKSGVEFADFLRKEILRSKPDHRIGRSWSAATRRTWALQLDRMARIDGRAWRRSAELVRWVASGCPGTQFEFVVESPRALREKWDRIDAAQQRAQRESKQQQQPQTAAQRYPGLEIKR